MMCEKKDMSYLIRVNADAGVDEKFIIAVP